MAYNKYILLDDDFSKSTIETCSVYPIWGYILKRTTLSIILFQWTNLFSYFRTINIFKIIIVNYNCKCRMNYIHLVIFYYSAYNNVGIGCAGLESRLGWKPMWVIYCYHFMVQLYVSVLLYLLKTNNIKSIYITVIIIIIEIIEII